MVRSARLSTNWWALRWAPTFPRPQPNRRIRRRPRKKQYRRRDSNPHWINSNRILNPARLPIPPLRQLFQAKDLRRFRVSLIWGQVFLLPCETIEDSSSFLCLIATIIIHRRRNVSVSHLVFEDCRNDLPRPAVPERPAKLVDGRRLLGLRRSTTSSVDGTRPTEKPLQLAAASHRSRHPFSTLPAPRASWKRGPARTQRGSFSRRCPLTNHKGQSLCSPSR
jgi:hypothetical protein